MGFWKINNAAEKQGRTELKTLVPAANPYVHVIEGQRSGWFEWQAGDYSAEVALDVREGKYVKVTAVPASEGCYVRQYDGRANVRWFGAIGPEEDGPDDDQPALQAAINVAKSIFVPNGFFRTESKLLLPDGAELHFESRNASINAYHDDAIVQGIGYETGERTFHVQIHGGTLQGRAGNRPIGIDFTAVSMGKVVGTYVYFTGDAVRNGGATATADVVGALYNEFHAVDVADCVTGYKNQSIGNGVKVVGGRIVSCETGTMDDDCSGNNYFGVDIEAFTGWGHRIASQADANNIRSIGCLLENPPSDPAYAGAVGVRWHDGASDIVVVSPKVQSVATPFLGGTGRAIIVGYDGNIRADLPASASGLDTGTLWSDGGTVKVAA